MKRPHTTPSENNVPPSLQCNVTYEPASKSQPNEKYQNHSRQMYGGNLLIHDLYDKRACFPQDQQSDTVNLRNVNVLPENRLEQNPKKFIPHASSTPITNSSYYHNRHQIENLMRNDEQRFHPIIVNSNTGLSH